MPKVTARDVAELAGVSPATVSRALNGTASVSPQLMERIKEAAQELGYNRAEKKETGNSLIGVLAPRLSRHFYADIIEGIVDTAANAGYGVVICPPNYGKITEYNSPPLFQEGGIKLEGLITMCRLRQEGWMSILSSQNIPIIQCCEYDEELQYPSVAIDDFEAAYNATMYLINMGHKKLSMFNSTLKFNHARRREDGFRSAMRDSGLEIREDWVLHIGDSEYNLAMTAAQELFSRDEIPEAVFTVTDDYAAGVVNGAGKLGLNVPDDISVVGFNDTEVALITEPTLTTVHQPRYEMGSTACNVLLRSIRNGALVANHIWIESSLVVRNSTKSRGPLSR